MASIEQDDLFNVQDDEEEDIEEEEEEDEDVEDQVEIEEVGENVDALQQEEQEEEDDSQMDIDTEDQQQQEVEDEEEDEDEEDNEEEENEEEEGDEDEEMADEDGENEDEEGEEEEEEEEEEDTSNKKDNKDIEATTKPSLEKKSNDEEKTETKSTPELQLPSAAIDESKDNDGDIFLGDDTTKQSDIPTPKDSNVDNSTSREGELPDDSNKKNKDKPIEQPRNEKGQESENTKLEESKDKEPLIEDGPKDQIQEDLDTNLSFREQIIRKAQRATEFDIIPQVAIPYANQCHTLAFTKGPKWILTGGEDGFIRKYDFIASIQGKSPLTMAQKHNLFSDSLTNAGVICSYWENEQPLTRKQLMNQNSKLKDSDFSTGSVSYEPKINPVYALDAEKNGYWCLSGLLSGGISLYTMRYNEGAIHYYFHQGSKENKSRGHTDAISVIKLNQEQDKFLSGSWDKTIRQWDLNTGRTVLEYTGNSGQISNIEFRPDGLSDVTFVVSEEEEEKEEEIQKKEKLNNKSGENLVNSNDDIDSLFGDSDKDEEMTDANKKDERLEEETRKVVESIDKPKSNNGATNKTHLNSNIFMSSSIDGTINIWDIRTSSPVIRLGVSEGTPPWCMSLTWSNNGDFIYAGRRNGTVEEISIKMPHKRSNMGHHRDTMIPNISKLLQFPKISGPVSAISTMPNDDFLLCGSNDNIRLYNLKLYDELNNVSINSKKQATPFLIVPGHHGGMLSQLYVDETGRFMVSASGYRGWGHGNYTDTVLIYEIDFQ